MQTNKATDPMMIVINLMIVAAIVTILLAVCAIGGLDYPNTIAGSIARFVWSLK